MRAFGIGFASIALVLGLAPLAAKPSDEAQQASAAAQKLGKQMYLHDQAAWHGTDALRELVDLSDHRELRGYVVEAMENGNLALIFYAEDDEGLFEFARFEVAESKVVGGGLVEGDRVALSPMLTRLTTARNSAMEHAIEQEWGLCTRSSPNFIMLPPDENDIVRVFILSSTEVQGMFPFGGHYRIDIDAEGGVENARRYTNSCLNLSARPNEDGDLPVAMGVSHLLDEHPTEIHYFQSYYVPIDVFVITDGDVWAIEKGKFREMIDMDVP